MIVLFDRSFSKSLDKLKDKQVKEKLKTLIITMESVNTIADIPPTKQMSGLPGFFRIRIGDYRLGFELTSDNQILLIRIAHRKDIYRRFP